MTYCNGIFTKYKYFLSETGNANILPRFVFFDFGQKHFSPVLLGLACFEIYNSDILAGMHCTTYYKYLFFLFDLPFGNLFCSVAHFLPTGIFIAIMYFSGACRYGNSVLVYANISMIMFVISFTKIKYDRRGVVSRDSQHCLQQNVELCMSQLIRQHY